MTLLMTELTPLLSNFFLLGLRYFCSALRSTEKRTVPWCKAFLPIPSRPPRYNRYADPEIYFTFLLLFSLGSGCHFCLRLPPLFRIFWRCLQVWCCWLSYNRTICLVHRAWENWNKYCLNRDIQLLLQSSFSTARPHWPSSIHSCIPSKGSDAFQWLSLDCSAKGIRSAMWVWLNNGLLTCFEEILFSCEVEVNIVVGGDEDFDVGECASDESLQHN